MSPESRPIDPAAVDLPPSHSIHITPGEMESGTEDAK